MSYCDAANYACDGYKPASDEQFLPPWAPGFKNYQGMYHNDLSGLYRFTSYAIAITYDENKQAKSVVACTDVSASTCTGNHFRIRSIMPMCSDGISIDCFKDFVVKDAEGKSLNYTVDGEFPKGNPQYFVGSTALKIPNGGGPTLIHIPGAPHNGGDAYLIKPELVSMKFENQSEFQASNMAISITAVKIINGKYVYGLAGTNPKLFNGGFDENGDDSGATPSYCALNIRYQWELNLD